VLGVFDAKPLETRHQDRVLRERHVVASGKTAAPRALTEMSSYEAQDRISVAMTGVTEEFGDSALNSGKGIEWTI